METDDSFTGSRLPDGKDRFASEERTAQRERETTIALLRLLNGQSGTRELIRKLTGFIRMWAGCEAVGLRLRSGEDFPYFETRGFPAGFVEAERWLCARDPAGQAVCDGMGRPLLECMCGSILSGRFDPGLPFFTERGSFWTNSTSDLPAEAVEGLHPGRLRNRCISDGYESVALIPLRHGSRILGLLQLNDHARGRFTRETISFLENVGEQVAMAIAQRISQEELRKSEERFRDIIDAAGEYIWEVDLDARATFISARVTDVLGYGPEELLGWKPFDLMPEPESHELRKLFPELLRGRGRVRNIEHTLVAKSGKVVWVSTTVVPITDTQGMLTGYRGVSMDITERKRAEEEKARLEDQLRQAQKMEAVGQLAGGVAHDFNNLMQVILGHVDLLGETSHPSGPGRAELEEIRKAALRAGELTSQLLAFSRRQVMQPTVLNLNDVVGGVLKMIGRVIGEHIELAFSAAEPLAAVRADRGQMEQVLMNLCVNARDAMRGGGKLVIETDSCDADESFCRENPWLAEGSYVVLGVTDTGCGMDRETIERIYDPFFTTKEEEKGTGLGLAVVYGIVRQHEGVIRVDSEPGRGSAFRIYLPACPQTPDAVRELSEEKPSGGTETILVAEDDPPVLKLVKLILENAGYRVITAVDGEDAVRVFDRHRGSVDLVLLDVVMPRLGGKGAMERISRRDPSMRFLFTSGYQGDAVGRDSVGEEGIGLIMKPYQRKALLKAVREALGDSRRSA